MTIVLLVGTLTLRPWCGATNVCTADVFRASASRGTGPKSAGSLANVHAERADGVGRLRAPSLGRRCVDAATVLAAARTAWVLPGTAP